LRKEDGKLFLKHEVIHLDTLNGLALRYGIKSSELKKVNGLWDDTAFYSKKILLIPWDKKKPIPQDQLSPEEKLRLYRQKLITRFCTQFRVSKEESTYYLTEAEWDFELASKERKEDVAFERNYSNQRSNAKKV